MRIEELLDGINKKYVLKGTDLLISCVNPDHEDSNPSMRVDRLTGVYHCFSCGTKGNLLREYGHVPSVLDVKSKSIKEKIQRLLTSSLVIPPGAMPFFHEHRGISQKVYEKFEAFTHTDHEGRIMFPIRNYSGNIYAFLGRYIHSSASPKYKVYPDNTSLNLYPTKPAVYKGSVILVEGLFDLLNLYEHGLKNVITGFGTSTLYKRANQMLEPYYILGVTKVYIMFDGDKAGNTAAEKLVKTIHDKYNPEVIILPEGTDPGSLDGSMIQQIKEGIYG
jgi:DNA primase